MARMHFIEKPGDSIKKTPKPSRKWKRLFYISLIFNIILALTTILVALKVV